LHKKFAEVTLYAKGPAILESGNSVMVNTPNPTFEYVESLGATLRVTGIGYGYVAGPGHSSATGIGHHYVTGTGHGTFIPMTGTTGMIGETPNTSRYGISTRAIGEPNLAYNVTGSPSGQNAWSAPDVQISLNGMAYTVVVMGSQEWDAFQSVSDALASYCSNEIFSPGRAWRSVHSKPNDAIEMRRHRQTILRTFTRPVERENKPISFDPDDFPIV
jgi:hypothetical protein